MSESKAPVKSSVVDEDVELDDADQNKYLLFRLGLDLYGTPLLGVREVIQPLTPKAIPNTVPYFMGLINLRGQVMGVVDLRVRFEYFSDWESYNQAYLVFDTEVGPIAAIVDKVEAVVKIDDANMHKKPNIRSQVPVEYLIGAATYQERIVTLIDLNRTLSQEDYVQIQKSKMQAG